jgi:hypothetical protein
VTRRIQQALKPTGSLSDYPDQRQMKITGDFFEVFIGVHNSSVRKGLICNLITCKKAELNNIALLLPYFYANLVFTTYMLVFPLKNKGTE